MEYFLNNIIFKQYNNPYLISYNVNLANSKLNWNVWITFAGFYNYQLKMSIYMSQFINIMEKFNIRTKPLNKSESFIVPMNLK